MKEFTLSLDFPGLCLFDPLVLTDFLKSNKIETTQVFDYFLHNPEIGKRVIVEGIILPIYSIPELDYKITCTIEDKLFFPKEWEVLEIDKFGLNVRSKTIILSDIFNIMDWDEPDFFLDYKNNLSSKTESTNYFELENGFYKIKTIGFREIDVNKSPLDLIVGYEFIFKKVEKLNINIDNIDIDNINYNVLPDDY